VYFPPSLHLTQKHSGGLETTKRRAIKMRREGKGLCRHISSEPWGSQDEKEASVEGWCCAAPGEWERGEIVPAVI